MSQRHCLRFIQMQNENSLKPSVLDFSKIDLYHSALKSTSVF
jgi:hypothetical protein